MNYVNIIYSLQITMSHLQGLKAPRKKDQLGGLGPDFECDAYKAAAEKAARKKEFEARAK